MKNISIIFFFLVLLQSCNIINPDETIPSYIQINSVKFDSNGRGSNSQNIINVWVYADNEFLGTFEMPVKIPVLKKGNVKIKVKAGIYQDGIKTYRLPYPFFKDFEISVNMEEAATLEIKPEFSYLDNTKFVFYEDFEDGVSAFDTINISTVNLELVGSGDYATDITKSNIGKINMKANKNDVAYIVSSSYLDLARGGKNVYLEFDYLSNAGFGVGLYTDKVEKKIDLNLNQNNNWTKVYVPLMEEIGGTGASTRLKLLFESNSSSNEDKFILLDNVKVVQFE